MTTTGPKSAEGLRRNWTWVELTIYLIFSSLRFLLSSIRSASMIFRMASALRASCTSLSSGALPSTGEPCRLCKNSACAISARSFCCFCISRGKYWRFCWNGTSSCWCCC